MCVTYFGGDILYTHASEVENTLPVVLSYVNAALFLLLLPQTCILFYGIVFFCVSSYEFTSNLIADHSSVTSLRVFSRRGAELNTVYPEVMTGSSEGVSRLSSLSSLPVVTGGSSGKQNLAVQRWRLMRCRHVPERPKCGSVSPPTQQQADNLQCLFA